MITSSGQATSESFQCNGQAASAGTARALDRAGALAMLVSLKGKYLVKRSAVTLGRTTSTHGKVSCNQVCPALVSQERPWAGTWHAKIMHRNAGCGPVYL